MKTIFTISFILSTLLTTAQDDKNEIMKVVNNVFEAMRTSDSTLLKSCFIENPKTYTVLRNKEGVTQFRTDDFQRFINAVGKEKEDVWNEPIWNEKVQVDDDLASVWVDYAFYLNDKFSHCGVDAFHLVRLDGAWKIFNLVDTRRREGCEIPDQVKP